MEIPFHDTNEMENIRVGEFFREHQWAVHKRTDRVFTVLLPIQWLAGVAAAWFIAPLTWYGESSSIHPHFWFAVIFGAAITSLPLYLTIWHPGETVTRHVVAVSQMLMSGLLIHVTGGRIETHFHVFGSLAFIAFYRDWRVLLSATLVTAADHFMRGWFYPFSAYGVVTAAEWRWLEHAGWVIFTDIFLIVSCVRGVKEMREIAKRAALYTSNEERYRAVVEQTTDGIALLETENLRVIECNEAFSRLMGCENIQQAKSMTGYDFTTVGRDELNELKAHILDQKNSVSGERVYRRIDGAEIPVDITFSLITYNGGQAFCLNVKDITGRKEAETEMVRLALVAKKTQNSVIVCNPEGYIQWVNEGFTRVTGYEIDEVVGKSPLLLCGTQTNADKLGELLMAIGERKPFEGELYNYKKDGSGYWVSISLMPITNEDGELQGYISIEMDITERKAMEEQLRRAHDDLEFRISERTSELVDANKAMRTEVAERKHAEEERKEAQEFLHTVIDNVPSLIFVKDIEGKYVLGNQALAKARGTTLENLIGKTRADFPGSPDEVDHLTDEDIALLERLEDKFIPEEKHTDADGNTHWYQTAKRSVVLGKNEARFLVGVSTDFTERKGMETQLQHSQKMESIGQLAAGIAHEINTPTQYVGDNTRFIRDAFTDLELILQKYGELLDSAEAGTVDPGLISDIKKELEGADLEYLMEEVPNALKQSLDGVSRIAKIVQSMKEFAHPGSREKQSADINRAIESTVTVARNEWKYVAEVETDFDENLPAVPCYLGEFNQVILNMVINAAHAITDVVGDGSEGKGRITITTTKADNEWAEVRIADTGKGIPADIHGRIFDPFFTTKEVGKGSGQGLAISHAVVVEKHGGQLTFETEQGHGTTFVIRLPLNNNQTPEPMRVTYD